MQLHAASAVHPEKVPGSYEGEFRHSPAVSPLLSSGFVPGLLSWSTVCALDEEHPMFGRDEERNLEKKKELVEAAAR